MHTDTIGSSGSSPPVLLHERQRDVGHLHAVPTGNTVLSVTICDSQINASTRKACTDQPPLRRASPTSQVKPHLPRARVRGRNRAHPIAVLIIVEHRDLAGRTLVGRHARHRIGVVVKLLAILAPTGNADARVWPPRVKFRPNNGVVAQPALAQWAAAAPHRRMRPKGSAPTCTHMPASHDSYLQLSPSTGPPSGVTDLESHSYGVTRGSAVVSMSTHSLLNWRPVPGQNVLTGHSARQVPFGVG